MQMRKVLSLLEQTVIKVIAEENDFYQIVSEGAGWQ